MSAQASVLLVGAGGIGAPLALALGAAGVRDMVIADDDAVEISNLHRQILFSDDDIGEPKLLAFDRALRRRFAGIHVAHRPRMLPGTVLEGVKSARVVVDATDNFASRFLLADACALVGVPIVHAAAVRWQATVLAVAAAGKPCYRCLFEDLPEGDAPDCATAGVAGPVCGVAGAVAADRVLRILAADPSAYGEIVTYDGLRDVLRAAPVRPRKGCPLCGDPRTILSIDVARYEAITRSNTGEVSSWRSTSVFQRPCDR